MSALLSVISTAAQAGYALIPNYADFGLGFLGLRFGLGLAFRGRGGVLSIRRRTTSSSGTLVSF